MNDDPPASAREVLIAEALGEVAKLLDRVDTLAAALDEAVEAANDACSSIEARAAAFEASAAALVEASKRHLVNHVATKTQQLTKAAGDAQLLAIRAEMHALIQDEMTASVRRVNQSGVAQRRWRWAAHVVTAISASLVTGVVMAYLLSS